MPLAALEGLEPPTGAQAVGDARRLERQPQVATPFPRALQRAPRFLLDHLSQEPGAEADPVEAGHLGLDVEEGIPGLQFGSGNLPAHGVPEARDPGDRSDRQPAVDVLEIDQVEEGLVGQGVEVAVVEAVQPGRQQAQVAVTVTTRGEGGDQTRRAPEPAGDPQEDRSPFRVGSQGAPIRRQEGQGRIDRALRHLQSEELPEAGALALGGPRAVEGGSEDVREHLLAVVPALEAEGRELHRVASLPCRRLQETGIVVVDEDVGLRTDHMDLGFLPPQDREQVDVDELRYEGPGEEGDEAAVGSLHEVSHRRLRPHRSHEDGEARSGTVVEQARGGEGAQRRPAQHDALGPSIDLFEGMGQDAPGVGAHGVGVGLAVGGTDAGVVDHEHREAESREVAGEGGNQAAGLRLGRLGTGGSHGIEVQDERRLRVGAAQEDAA